MADQRRHEDTRPSILLAAPREWPEETTRWFPRAPDLIPGHPAGCSDEEKLVVLLEQDEEMLAVAAARVCRIPGGQEDLESVLPYLGRERALVARRNRLPDQLISYFEELNDADDEASVLRALATHAARIVSAHRSVVLARAPGASTLTAISAAGASAPLNGVEVGWNECLARPGLLLAQDLSEGGRCPGLAPLGIGPETELVVHVPVGQEGVLILTERRENRVLQPQDWDVLHALALQARMVLRRVRLLESVRQLSLTDSLTGLANRRHMRVVLEHAWAAALRGERLSVMVLDLDDFKQVNDQHGHVAGDQLLCEVAEVMRAEVRGSDAVVRYGGDEFLVVLPGSDDASARALAERLVRRLTGIIGVSIGIAEYRPELQSPDALIRLADQRLYEGKRGRRSAAGLAQPPGVGKDG